jgi:hypothetical protein
MTAMPPQGPAIKGKAQPNIYSMLLVVAVVVLIATIGIVVYDLMAVYGLSFVDLFTAHKIPPGR